MVDYQNKEIFIYWVRHGERMDETPGEKVEDIEYMNDPPITERGKVQCR